MLLAALRGEKDAAVAAEDYLRAACLKAEIDAIVARKRQKSQSCRAAGRGFFFSFVVLVLLLILILLIVLVFVVVFVVNPLSPSQHRRRRRRRRRRRPLRHWWTHAKHWPDRQSAAAPEKGGKAAALLRKLADAQLTPQSAPSSASAWRSLPPRGAGAGAGAARAVARFST